MLSLEKSSVLSERPHDSRKRPLSQSCRRKKEQPCLRQQSATIKTIHLRHSHQERIICSRFIFCLLLSLIFTLWLPWWWLTGDLATTSGEKDFSPPMHPTTIDATRSRGRTSHANKTHSPIEGTIKMPMIVKQSSSTPNNVPHMSQPSLPNPQQSCLHWEGTMTAQQVEQDVLSQPPPKGLLVTLVLGDSVLDVLCRFFPSQLQHLVLPQQNWDILFVLGRLPPNGNNTRNLGRAQEQAQKRRYKLISCLHLVPAIKQEGDAKSTRRTWKNIDGSSMQTEEYRISVGSHPATIQNQTHDTIIEKVRVFLAEVQLQFPRYIQANPSLLKVPVIPRQCQAPLAYILGTKWYVHEMLHLGILQEYDWFIKLDADVVFRKTLPLSLLHDLATRRAVWGHTGEYPDSVVPPCGLGITRAVQAFLTQRQTGALPLSTSPSMSTNAACSRDHPNMHKDADLYYTNFVMGKVAFFTSPAVLSFSQFLAEYPQGFFQYRWTDQIFFHFALGLYFEHAFDESNDIVVDYSEFRCAPHANCWMSVHYYNQDRCDNGGIFFHTKAKSAPTSDSSWTWKEEWEADQLAATQQLNRSSTPYQVKYKDLCRNLQPYGIG